MPFWQYSDDESEEDVDIAPSQPTSEPAPTVEHTGRNTDRHILTVLSDSDDDERPAPLSTPPMRQKRAAPILEDEELDCVLLPAKQAKSKDDEPLPLHQLTTPESKQAEMWRELQESAAKAAAADNLDEDEGSETPGEAVPAPRRHVSHSARLGRTRLDDASVEADLDREMAKERAEIAASLAAGTHVASTEPVEGELVLTAKCKAGEVKIRQKKDGPFTELLTKFKQHAVKKGWAVESSSVKLLFDDEEVDEDECPETVGVEHGDVVDIMFDS